MEKNPPQKIDLDFQEKIENFLWRKKMAETATAGDVQIFA